MPFKPDSRTKLETEIETTIKRIIREYINQDRILYLSVEQVLKHSSYSCSIATFRSCCEKLNGESPVQLIHKIRMNIALGLLRTDITIKEVSRLSGYSDQAKFSRKFRQLYDMSPTDYKRTLAE